MNKCPDKPGLCTRCGRHTDVFVFGSLVFLGLQFPPSILWVCRRCSNEILDYHEDYNGEQEQTMRGFYTMYLRAYVLGMSNQGVPADWIATASSEGLGALSLAVYDTSADELLLPSTEAVVVERLKALGITVKVDPAA